MASLTDLMVTYMSKVLPRYNALEKQLTGTGKEDLKVVLNWVRDVFCTISLYSAKARDLEKEKVALAEENAELQGQIERLTQKNLELEEEVNTALGLNENK